MNSFNSEKISPALRFAEKHLGFLTENEVNILMEHISIHLRKRLSVLVRCGRNRFICSLVYLRDRIKEVQDTGDYVRDVSIPAGEIFKNEWVKIGYNPKF